MTAALITLADALVTELNAPIGTTWSQTFTAALKFRIRKDLELLGDAVWEVHVAMAGEKTEIHDRTQNQADADIDVAIFKKANPDVPAEVKPVLNLQDEFKSYWLRRHPVAATGQVCTTAEKMALWVPKKLEEQRVCVSVLRLTFRTIGVGA